MLKASAFYTIFGCLFLTVLLNLLLIFLVFRMRKLPKDMLYIVILAISDCIPFISCVIIIIGRAASKQFGEQDSTQQILGFINVCWLVISSQCAACLAKYRLDVVSDKKPNNILLICSTISSIICLSCLVASGSQNEYISYNGAISQLYPETSALSAYTFYHFTLHLLIHSMIVISNYLILVYRTSQITYDLKLDSSTTQDIPIPLKRRANKVFLKGLAFVLVSAIILIPGACLHLAEGYLIPNEGIDVKVKTIITTVKPTLLISSCIINSLLVLFFHSGLNAELKKLFCSRKRESLS